MVRCPKCNSALPPNASVGQVAQCRICTHVFELGAGPAPERPAPAPAPPPPTAVAPPLPPREPSPLPDAELPSLEETRLARRTTLRIGHPPSTVKVRAHKHGIELILPWHKDLNFAGHAIGTAMWVVPLVMFVQAAPGDFGLVGTLLGLGFALFFFYSWVTHLVNHTTVLVGRGGVEVSHGPLPNVNRTVVRRADEIARLHLREIEHRTSRGGRWSKYQIEATGQRAGVLTKDWNRRRSLVFVQEAIEQMMELPPGT